MRGHKLILFRRMNSSKFPFLFGGTFIEGDRYTEGWGQGLFPFLFGGTFIEGPQHPDVLPLIDPRFPFLFGGTFIEGGKQK